VRPDAQAVHLLPVRHQPTQPRPPTLVRRPPPTSSSVKTSSRTPGRVLRRADPRPQPDSAHRGRGPQGGREDPRHRGRDRRTPPPPSQHCRRTPDLPPHRRPRRRHRLARHPENPVRHPRHRRTIQDRELNQDHKRATTGAGHRPARRDPQDQNGRHHAAGRSSTAALRRFPPTDPLRRSLPRADSEGHLGRRHRARPRKPRRPRSLRCFACPRWDSNPHCRRFELRSSAGWDTGTGPPNRIPTTLIATETGIPSVERGGSRA
jgi:hypothetical protein